MHRTLINRLLSLVAVALLSPLAAAAVPVVQRVSEPPALNPLQMLIGGRVSVIPSAAAKSFGGRDFISEWPGIYFRAAFVGNKVFFRVGPNDEILHVVVDSVSAQPLVKPQPGVYEIEELDSQAHTVSVFVATESQTTINSFGGFAIPKGEKSLSPRKRRREIEFIGDSHTVGYGNLSDKRTCTNDEVWKYTDDTEAFGAIIATHYDADYQVNAISGRGVVRNYGGFPADTMPEAYPYVLFNKVQLYSNRSWQPQVIVIALGTNDFSTPLKAGERWKTRYALHADFEQTYARFLRDLRARNPRSLILVWATDLANGEIAREVKKVVEMRTAQGDTHINFVLVNNLSFSGCNWHPSIQDDKLIADELEHRIDEYESAWQSE